MKRGDLVTVAVQGDCGKLRPAVVIQSDQLGFTQSVLVCPLTSTLVDSPFHRVLVKASALNGLSVSSQIMADKILAVRRDKCGPRIGALETELVDRLDEVLALVIGLADRQPRPRRQNNLPGG